MTVEHAEHDSYDVLDVPAEPVRLVDHHPLEEAALGILEQPPEGGTIHMPATIPIVDIMLEQRKAQRL